MILGLAIRIKIPPVQIYLIILVQIIKIQLIFFLVFEIVIHQLLLISLYNHKSKILSNKCLIVWTLENNKTLLFQTMAGTIMTQFFNLMVKVQNSKLQILLIVSTVLMLVVNNLEIVWTWINYPIKRKTILVILIIKTIPFLK